MTGSRSEVIKLSATTGRAVPWASPTPGTAWPTPGSRGGCPSPAAATSAASASPEFSAAACPGRRELPVNLRSSQMTFSVADVNQRLSTGTVSPGFEAVRNQLDAYLLADPAYDSVTGVFSVSKGISALVIATLVRDGELGLDEPVARYWPEFAAEGKAAVTVRQLLSHQAGLVGLPGGMSFEELRDSSLAAARLADTFPDWLPGSAFGYHGLTIGVFMEELTRRITGRSLQSVYESAIRAPHDIDFYLGFPAGQEHRFREVLPMAPTSAQQAEIDRRASAPDGITALAFNSAVRGPS